MTALTVPNRALPPAEFAELDRDVEQFAKVCDSFETEPIPSCDLAECKEMLVRLPALRARWAAVDRPVTTDDIADEIVRLTAAFSPNTTRADMDAFAVVLAEDVADLRPTIYALRRACKQYRAKYRFLG